MLSVKNLHLNLNSAIILEQVSFTLEKGETLCVIGESGSGKTSLLRALQGLLPARFDDLLFRADGADPIRHEGKWHGAAGLPHSRWVMQDPLAALTPRQPLGVSIAESLYRQKRTRRELDSAVADALQSVDLPRHFAARRPSEVSMGQAQRACLARALIARPSLIFFDEPLSALDTVVQKQVAVTMDRIQQQHVLSYVVVTHDLGYAAAYADQILVLRHGKVEACQRADAFFRAPGSAYCEALIDAAQVLGELAPPQGADTTGLEARP